MKTIYVLLCSLTLITSCTTTYKAGQTPDDVYYSPTKPQYDYASTSTSDNEDYYSYRDDQYLRMKIRNRRLSSIDDFNYWYGSSWNYTYNPWGSSNVGWPYHYGGHYGSGWYDPCCHGPVVVIQKYPVYTPSNSPSSLKGYRNNQYNNSNYNVNKGGYKNTYNNSNDRYIPSNSNNSATPNRSYNPPVNGNKANDGPIKVPTRKAN